jgi:hypothetical protein
LARPGARTNRGRSGRIGALLISPRPALESCVSATARTRRDAESTSRRSVGSGRASHSARGSRRTPGVSASRYARRGPWWRRPEWGTCRREVDSPATLPPWMSVRTPRSEVLTAPKADGSAELRPMALPRTRRRASGGAASTGRSPRTWSGAERELVVLDDSHSAPKCAGRAVPRAGNVGRCKGFFWGLGRA